MDECVTLKKEERATKCEKETMYLRLTPTTLKFSGENHIGNH